MKFNVTLGIIMAIALSISCNKPEMDSPGEAMMKRQKVYNWGVKVYYKDGATGQPLIGKGRTFSYGQVKAEVSAQPLAMADTGADNYFIYQQYADLKEPGELPGLDFSKSKVIELDNGARVIRDSIVLVKKQGAETFDVLVNGQHYLSAPSPTTAGDIRSVTLSR